MVGSTPGSFVASSLTDNGTTVSTTEAFTATGQIQSNGIVRGLGGFYGCNDNANFLFSDVGGVIGLRFGGADPTTANWIGLLSGSPNGDFNLYLQSPAGSGFVFRNGATQIAHITSTVATLPSLTLTAATTATTATAGTATLPTSPLGFVEMVVNGTTVKLPYYSV
jgi:hypothetical protein